MNHNPFEILFTNTVVENKAQAQMRFEHFAELEQKREIAHTKLKQVFKNVTPTFIMLGIHIEMGIVNGDPQITFYYKGRGNSIWYDCWTNTGLFHTDIQYSKQLDETGLYKAIADWIVLGN